jgi:hypothetical protein
MNQTQDPDSGEEVGGLIIFGIVSAGQGIIIKTLFKSAAEAIRLLRKIAQ